MSNKMFMRVEDVAEEMGVSVSYAYKLIRKLNKELQSTGCITIPGRIDRKFFLNLESILTCSSLISAPIKAQTL